MTTQRLALIGGVLAGASGLATGVALVQAGLVWLLPAAALAAIGWLAWWGRGGQRYRALPGVATVLLLAAAAGAVFQNGAVLAWSYAAALAALAAWDVSAFFGRITAVARHDAVDRLILRHLAVLGVVLLTAALGLVVRQLWQPTLTFNRTLLLAALLIYGLTRLVRAGGTN